MSEQQFIRSAAPTLAGLKTGSLFPYRFERKKDAMRELRQYNRRLMAKGLRLLPLRMTEDYAMLYLYRPGRLGADLRRREAADLLQEVGYPDCGEANCIRELRRRLSSQTDFPHEIGLFLSYPPEDVRAFMEHRDSGCKCIGCWKVYGDERAARIKFAQYEKCTLCYLRQHARGCPLEELTVTNKLEGETLC